MAKEPKQLDDLFHDTLKDIYYAEKKILAALPKMAKAAQNPDLKAALRSTKVRQKSRLLASNRSSPPSTRSHRARSALPSRASSTRARRHGRLQGLGCARCRINFSGAGRLTLRDNPLRDARHLGR